MNYRTKIKDLIEQVSTTDWEFHEACKTQNRKVFPFYCHASLCNYHYENNEPVLLPKILYDDHPENVYDDTCYWGWVVWEDVQTVKLYEDHPGKYYSRLYGYNEQIHGWPEPIVLNEKFENSLEHRAVWFMVIGHYASTRYLLNDYKNTGIEEKIYSEKIKQVMTGGSHWGTNTDESWYEYSSAKGLELNKDIFEKPYLKLSHSRIISIINDILYENADRKQLTLF